MGPLGADRYGNTPVDAEGATDMGILAEPGRVLGAALERARGVRNKAVTLARHVSDRRPIWILK
ncbi:MAG: hypothetical protein ACRDYC_11595 [Acidimicrobiales bacterium]